MILGRILSKKSDPDVIETHGSLFFKRNQAKSEIWKNIFENLTIPGLDLHFATGLAQIGFLTSDKR